MKTIFITISRGSLIRNYFKTGFIQKLLAKNIKVVVLTQHHSDKVLFKEFEHKNLFFEPLIWKPSLIDDVLMEFARGIVYSKTVLARYKYRDTGNPPRKILYYPRILFFSWFRFIPGIKKLLRKLQLILYPQKENDYLFKKYKPNLVFITDFADPGDTAIAKSAIRNKIKTVGITKSWDNFSKHLFRIKTDKIFVWGEFCKKNAIAYQDYKENEIDIIGGLQFDYYQPINLMSREEFCQSLGLDKDKKIIFYGSTGAHCKDDHEYIGLLLDFIAKTKMNAQILIRPHLGYKDDDKKFFKYKDNKNVVIYQNKQNLNLKDRWDLSDDHLKYLYNSIYHSSVSINIASTLALDSIAIGTPAINIKFDVTPKEDQDSVLRFYKTDYIDAVAKFGGIYLAKSSKEFSDILEKILIKRENKKETAEKMRNYFLYKVDGQAGERLLKNILKMLDEN